MAVNKHLFKESDHPRVARGEHGGEFASKATQGESGFAAMAKSAGAIKTDPRAEQVEQEFKGLSSDLASTPSKLTSVDFEKTKRASTEAARQGYAHAMLPGGQLDAEYGAGLETAIKKWEEAKSDALTLLASKGHNKEIRERYGLDSHSAQANIDAMNASVGAYAAQVTALRNLRDKLSKLALAVGAGHHAEVALEDPAAPDSRKTDISRDFHERLHTGAVMLDQDFPTTVQEGGVRFVGAPPSVGNSVPKLKATRDNLVAKALNGIRGKYWYEISSKAILNMVHGDKVQAEKLAEILAIYSAHTALAQNLDAAVRAFNQYQEGARQGKYIPIRAGVTGDQDRLAEAVLYGDANWTGRKISNFYKNLMSEIDPTHTVGTGSTVDLWVLRAMGYPPQQGAPSDAQYSFAENMLAQVGKELEAQTGKPWLPRQVQAAIWESERANVQLNGREPKPGQTAARSPYAVAQGRVETALKVVNRLMPKADRLEALLQPGAYEHNFTAIERRFEGDLQKLGPAPKGADIKWISDHEAALLKGEEPPKVPKSMDKDVIAFMVQLDRIQRNRKQALSNLDNDYKAAVNLDDAQHNSKRAMSEAETIRANAYDPQRLDFQGVSAMNNVAQENLEFIPHTSAGVDLGDIEHAPYAVKQKFLEAMLPLASDLLEKSGVLRGVKGNGIGMSDYKGVSNDPMVALDLLMARANYGGARDTEHGFGPSGKVDPFVKRNIDLANAALGYLFQQEAAAYITMRALNPSTKFYGKRPIVQTDLGTAGQFKDPKEVDPDALVIGDDEAVRSGDVNYRPADIPDMADGVHFKLQGGHKLAFKDWDALIATRTMLAHRYGFDPGEMPLIPTTGGDGFATINLTGKDNRLWHRITDELVEDAGADIPVEAQYFANDGNYLESGGWSQGGKGGENYIKKINDLGGRALLDYIQSHLVPERDKVYKQFKDWRNWERQDSPERGDQRTPASA